jgi:NAD(P)H-dependent FMN reductase
VVTGLRAQSYNSGALQAVASLLPSGKTYSVASLADVPFYNFDVEQPGDCAKDSGADATRRAGLERHLYGE